MKKQLSGYLFCVPIENKLSFSLQHKDLLNERKKRYQRGELKMLSLDELRSSFNSRVGFSRPNNNKPII